MIGPFTLNHLAAAAIVLLTLTCFVLAHKLLQARRQLRRQRYFAPPAAPAKKESQDGK